LAAFVISELQRGFSPATALLSMSLVAVMCGAVQVASSLAKIGRLIKYMPYPVVSGFSTGVGVMIVIGQIPHHLATIGKGDYFGEMSFLDRAPRSADAVADVESEVHVLTRDHFDSIAAEHRMLAMNLLEGMAAALASRLRRTDQELRSYQEN
jgi:CRP-like cAMP-binding protein